MSWIDLAANLLFGSIPEPIDWDEREQMTQEEWEENQAALMRHLEGVEERFWGSVAIKPQWRKDMEDEDANTIDG